MALEVLLVVGIGAAARCEGPASLRLAEDGKSRVTIVLPEKSGKQSALAAADLVRCLGKALGVEAPTVSTPNKVTTPLSIEIGEPKPGVEEMGIQRDGFTIKTDVDSVTISGVSDFGIANGVYAFLTDYVGVRWFAPGELYEVVASNGDLTLPQVSVLKNPDFTYRIFSGVTGPAGADWLRRIGIDVDRSNLPYFGFGHNLYTIIPQSVYGKSHPEYFPMIGGKRFVPPTDDYQGYQPCLTNPEVVQIAAKCADEFFKKNPTATTYSLCINDGMGFCECPNCQALDQPMRKANGGWPTYSDSYFHFVSEVAKIVEKTNPGKYLGCYAYWGVEPTPRIIDKLPDSVVIALTQDTSQHFDPAYKQRDRDLWLAWSKVAKHLGKYDYYGLGWLTPRCFPHLAADDIRFIHANSAVGFYCEVYPNWSVTGPQLYMASRLVWDGSLDADTLLDEYYSSLYGPAAGEVRKFYSILEKYWARERPGQWFQGLDNVRPELAMADADAIEDAWQCLFRAKSLVMGPEAQRLADLEDHFKLTYTVVKSYALSRKLATWKVTDRQDLAKLVSDSLSALEIVRLAYRDHKEKWLTDPLYTHCYYEGDRFHRKFWAWEDEVRAGVQTGLLTASDYARTKLSKEEYNTVWKDLRERMLSDPTAKAFKILDSLDPKMTCRSVRRPMKIDGDLSDWKGIEELQFDPNRWGDGKDIGCTAFFKIAWDRNYFYFACEVTDAEHVQDRSDGGLWEKDSVQIGFDPKLDALAYAGYGEDDSELGLALSPDGPVVWRWKSPKGLAGGRVSEIKSVVQRVGDKTIYEAAIPWSQLAFAKVGKETKFGFSVVVNDAGTKRPRAFLEWGGGIARSKDPRQFVPARLR